METGAEILAEMVQLGYRHIAYALEWVDEDGINRQGDYDTAEEQQAKIDDLAKFGLTARRIK